MPPPADEPLEDAAGGSHRVFVYGSLKSGGSNHHLLADAALEDEASVEGLEMYDTGRGFPACVPGDGEVQGEVYRVDDATLAAVDRLEGVPDFYERRERDGMWVYVWAAEPEPGWDRVPDGSWPTGRR